MPKYLLEVNLNNEDDDDMIFEEGITLEVPEEQLEDFLYEMEVIKENAFKTANACIGEEYDNSIEIEVKGKTIKLVPSIEGTVNTEVEKYQEVSHE